MTDTRAARPETAADAPPSTTSLIIGAFLLAIVVLNLLHGFGVGEGTSGLADALSIAVLVLLAPRVRGSRHVFLALSVLIGGYCLFFLPDPMAVLKPALDQGSFIVAFFCALASLQHVASRSAAISRAATFLASQPSGRRYLALAFGAQVFALMLNYGALSLLGTMARRSAEQEPEPAVRALRTRRMLQGAQCGFSASLTWSPLAFAPVITSALIPGATLSGVVVHGLGSALIIVVLGWLVDRRLKNSLPSGTVVAPPNEAAARDTRSLWPLAWLLMGVAIPAVLLEVFVGVEPSRSVLGLVPIVAAIWVLVETETGGKRRELGARSHHYLFRDLPSFKAELVLLSTAGFIGSAAGAVLAQWIAAAGIDLGAVPARLLLVLPLILVPLAGQLGLNPILFVSLFAQLLPSPAEMGVAPVAMVLALTGGWALCAPTSPFTASVMIIARISGASPREIAFRWNGVFVLLAMIGLALWVQVLA
ncbi:hypothetical protein [Acidimangrovimonas sediminis]|uniref:hypothetical protein n=1 Tax=Acidimangrovimonas sediminis TaxID=2056283 RepID=UPI000C7FAD32|nr:hypothetical protein [Acidimangrovimonas sediminis]